MEKLRMQTPDIAEENYRKLAELFPDAVTETTDEDGNVVRAIDKDVLMLEINTKVVDDGQERYQFTWPDKRKSVILANQPISKTLRFEKEKSVGKDGTPGGTDSENIYIEGDNLEALKLLQETYLGKVKMIYIDPPYNTGNDFIYEDDFSESAQDYADNSGQTDEEGNQLVQNSESNGRFHTDWLNMMYPRLKMAKDLLSDDGVIFISIDDNEVENLKKICDELFGEENFVNLITINMNSLSGVKMTHAITGKRFPAQKEYALLYGKSSSRMPLNIGKLHKNHWDKEYNLIIPELSKTQFNEFKNKSDELINMQLKDMHIEPLSEFFQKNNIQDTDEWKWENAYRIFGSKSNRPLAKRIKNADFENQIVCYTNKDGNKRFFRSDFNREARDPRIELVQAEANSSVFLSDNWTDISNDGGIAQEGGVVFPNGKKPLKLIRRFISTSNIKDGLIMDFFSGSATTAHAVMQMNAEDHGNRRFILVQIPEATDVESEAYKDGLKNICEIGEKRIINAGMQIKEETNADIDYGFRCFKIDSSNMKDVYYRPSETKQMSLDDLTDNIKEDRTPEDLLIQVMLDLGVLLSSKVEQEEIDGKNVFSVADDYLIACFDNDVNEDVVTTIAKRHPYYAVFRDSSMADDSVAANFEQIFATYSPETVRKVL